MQVRHTYRIVETFNGRKDLFIDFEDPKYQVLSTFLECDVRDFGNSIKRDFDEVLSGRKDSVDTGGNVCYVKITRNITRVYNDLAEDGEEFNSAECEIKTGILRELVEEFYEREENIRKENDKNSTQ